MSVTRKALTVAALAGGLAGCDGVSDPDDAARVSIYLTDAPGAVTAVWLAVEQINLHGEDGAVGLLSEPTDLIEITTLADEVMLLASEVVIEPGTYTQVRFVVQAGVLETEGGAVYTLGGAEHPDGLEATGQLMCPSCGQSGLKVQMPGGLELTAGHQGVLLDFDVSQSFGHQAGASGMWIMHPVVRASRFEVVEGEPGDELASIQGTVTVAEDATGAVEGALPECPTGTPGTLSDFVPLASATTLVDDEAEPLVVSGTTGEDGTFEIAHLMADTWDMGYAPETIVSDAGDRLAFTATVAPASAVLAEGVTVTGVAYTITSVACVPPAE